MQEAIVISRLYS